MKYPWHLWIVLNVWNVCMKYMKWNIYETSIQSIKYLWDTYEMFKTYLWNISDIYMKSMKCMKYLSNIYEISMNIYDIYEMKWNEIFKSL